MVHEPNKVDLLHHLIVRKLPVNLFRQLLLLGF